MRDEKKEESFRKSKEEYVSTFDFFDLKGSAGVTSRKDSLSKMLSVRKSGFNMVTQREGIESSPHKGSSVVASRG